eukprot:4622549-Heterocapsa_arctica.AAC.1
MIIIIHLIILELITIILEGEGSSNAFVEGPPSTAVEVRVPAHAPPPPPGRPELVGRGLGGDMTLRWRT